jgi:Transposase DDE domain
VAIWRRYVEDITDAEVDVSVLVDATELFTPRLIFERSLELAAELGLIEGAAEQIVDSTPMLGAAAVQDTATLVRSGVRRLLDAVEASDEGAAYELASGLRFDYSRPREKPAGDWRDKAVREALLAEVARDAERALRAVEEDAELAADAAIAEAARLLREIVGQEFEVEDDEVPRPRRGRRTRRIVSAHDPEMRHGRQTAARPFSGYKIHAAAAAEAPILTSITLSPANEHDGHQAGVLVAQQPERRRPKRVIGDTAYGNVEAREQLEERSISVLAPVHSTSPKDGTIPKEAFAIELETDTVTCPEGKTAPIYKPRPNRKRPIRRSAIGERVAKFSRSDCEPCPLRQRCSPSGQRDIRIRRREDLRQAALRALSDPAERDHLKRTRPRIERLLGLIVHRYRGRKSRYLGPRKSAFQAVWTAVLVNLHPIGAARCGPRRHRSEPGSRNTHARSRRAGGRERRGETTFFSGLRRKQASVQLGWCRARARYSSRLSTSGGRLVLTLWFHRGR